MPIEILTRVHLPIAPIDPDELARKADLTAVAGGVHFDANPPASPGVGQQWITPDRILSVWDGNDWLRITGPLVWNSPGLVWR